jgi:polyisoprenoid-binding protein YceI
MLLRSRLFLSVAVVLVLLVAVGGFVFWYLILRDDAPAKVSLDSAVNSLSTPAPSGTTPATSAAASPTAAATSSNASSSAGLAGTWVPDTSQSNFLGYRVVEQLATVGANTAVGRTKGVTGSVVLTDSSVTSGTITADMTRLSSDNNLRDGQLRNQGIEYSKFPTATFVLNAGLALPAGLSGGQAVNVDLPGKLTLHGVTKDVTVPAQAQLKNGNLVVVGSIDIKFSDYSISKPNGASVLSIEDHGTMELQLILKKS